jgi:uracil-DNA glycosylase
MRISLAAVSARGQGLPLCEQKLPGAAAGIPRRPDRRLLIVGQAPGGACTRPAFPWNDPSGDVLRDVAGDGRETFYDTSRIAIVPMGLCYPGTVDGADLPPRRLRAALAAALPRRAADISLTLLVGIYAQAYYLGSRKQTLGEPCAPIGNTCPSSFRCRIRAGATRLAEAQSLVSQRGHPGAATAR